jgi:hypothetical protein
VQSEGYKAGFRLSLRNSVQRASRELNIPWSISLHVLQRILRFHANKVQWGPATLRGRTCSTSRIFLSHVNTNRMWNRIMFSSRASSSLTKQHFTVGTSTASMVVWGSETAHVVTEHESPCAQINVPRAQAHEKVTLFFTECTLIS